MTRHDAVTRFLAALVGGEDDGLLELRYRLPDGQRMGRVFEPPSRLEALATRALMLAAQTDVYVGCAPRTRRSGGRDAVDHANVLWVDCDDDEAVIALEHFEPAPSIVIASGSGPNCHAYWPLTQALPRDDVENANRRLAHALGADLTSADAARILRVPETFSHKHHPPARVYARRLETERRIAAADIVADLPDAPQRAGDGARAAGRGREGDPLLAITPDDYVHRLLGVQVPSHRKVPCPFHADHHPSLHVYATPAQGWYCFGRCQRGGSIYDLAAPLLGYQPRGQEFVDLRRELRALFELHT